MAIRPYWSGQITISLVSFSVRLFVATEAKGEIHFHNLSRKTGERVKYQKVSGSETSAAKVEQEEIVKGYEYRKGEYITIESSELDELRVPSKHTMEVTQFVSADEIDPEYFEKPYFVTPENDSQAQAFAVVRQALKETKKIALSKIAFGGREHIVAICPTEDDSLGGMMAYTMRYAAELRDPKEYFRDIQKPKVEDDSLDLAKQLIERKTAKFDPTKFVDGYEVALKELVQAKIDHAPIPKDEAPKPQRGQVVNLMDALRKSIGKATPAESEAALKGTGAGKAHAAGKKQGLALVKAAPRKTASKAVKRKSA